MAKTKLLRKVIKPAPFGLKAMPGNNNKSKSMLPMDWSPAIANKGRKEPY